MLKNVVLMAVSILLAGLTVEGGLRLLGYTPLAVSASSDQNWSRPNTAMGRTNRAGRFASGEAGNAEMNFDADGRRAVPPGPAGAPRVDVVGHPTGARHAA